MKKEAVEESINEAIIKITKLLAKDIYINNNLYDNVIDKYKYLYIECSKHENKYKDNINYLKFLKLKTSKLKFIKNHNKKFLKQHLIKDKDYFDNMYDKLDLSLKDREILLVEDNLVVNNKNDYQKIILILSKVRYLLDKSKYKDKDITIIVGNKEIYKDLVKLLKNYKIKINIYLYTTIINNYCKDNKLKLINNKEKFSFLENYFKREIFSNKELLREYITNYKYLYFNKDVYDYDTLNDYHNYMFTRKYLESGLAKKDYINSIIMKKRNNLISINNDKLRYKEEVDIANYLYLHNIRYKIIYSDKPYFKINSLEFYYVNYIEENNNDKYFKLYKKYKHGNLLSHLKKLLKQHNIEELIMDKNILRNKIKNESADIYYRDFIDNILIPYIDSNNSTDKTMNIYKKAYLEYLKENNLIDEYLLINKISKKKEYNVKYLIMDNNYINTNSIKLIIC